MKVRKWGVIHRMALLYLHIVSNYALKAVSLCNLYFTGKTWMDSFNYVKSKRICCAPNTAFTCNLIEINECFKPDFKAENILLFRLASHLIPDDPNTTGQFLNLFYSLLSSFIFIYFRIYHSCFCLLTDRFSASIVSYFHDILTRQVRHFITLYCIMYFLTPLYSSHSCLIS